VLTADQFGGVYTAWTFNSPWLTNYLVFDASGATGRQFLTGAISPGESNGPDAAHQAAKAGGYFDQFYAYPAGVPQSEITFAAAKTLIFAVPDNILSGNTSGLSALVARVSPSDTSAVPEPASLALAGIGLGCLAVRARRRPRGE
jgi:hypothetical protein